MSGCSECESMAKDKEWGPGTAKVLEVWQPIVEHCLRTDQKAWVKNPNNYIQRLPFQGIRVTEPSGKSKFWQQQREFVRQYNNNRTEDNWNLLHPVTQSQLRF